MYQCLVFCGTSRDGHLYSSLILCDGHFNEWIMIPAEIQKVWYVFDSKHFDLICLIASYRSLECSILDESFFLKWTSGRPPRSFHQWIILALAKGGRDYITQKAIFTCYILPIGWLYNDPTLYNFTRTWKKHSYQSSFIGKTVVLLDGTLNNQPHIHLISWVNQNNSYDFKIPRLKAQQLKGKGPLQVTFQKFHGVALPETTDSKK